METEQSENVHLNYSNSRLWTNNHTPTRPLANVSDGSQSVHKVFGPVVFISQLLITKYLDSNIVDEYNQSKVSYETSLGSNVQSPSKEDNI